MSIISKRFEYFVNIYLYIFTVTITFIQMIAFHVFVASITLLLLPFRKNGFFEVSFLCADFGSFILSFFLFKYDLLRGVKF